ncbi:hypothetical protein H9L39_12387 [Fusarium oxysporum f. sp. albedinis]|nr:hypothetical protein H9L39_12387 [Fusarium oxysporum f. sp. albedinis]
MEDDSQDDRQVLDLTQWDYNDLDFRTPQLSGINSRGVSLADPSPSPSYPETQIAAASVRRLGS